MSCRETSAGSAFTTWARHVTHSELTDSAVQSTFHRLRSVYLSRSEENRREYSEDDYRAILDRQINRIRINYNLTDAEKNSLLERLETARNEPVPEQAVVYALANLVPAVKNRMESQKTFIASIAERTGETPESVTERFKELASAPVNEREDVTREDTEQAASMGLARDKGTVSAMLRMESEARHIEMARAVTLPQAVTRTVLSSPYLLADNYVILEHGWDSRSGRMEILIDHDGEQKLYAYKNVPADIAEQVQHDPSSWSTLVRGNPNYQYADEYEKKMGGVAPKCKICGQFADESHQCDPREFPISYSQASSRVNPWEHQQVELYYVPVGETEPENYMSDVFLPQEEVLLPGLLRGQPADISFRSSIVAMVENEDGYIGPESMYVGGDLRVTLEDGKLNFNTDNINCRCIEYSNTGNCSHIDVLKTAVQEKYMPFVDEEKEQEVREARIREAVEIAATRQQRRIETAMASNWMVTEAGLAEASGTWRQDAEVLYSEDIDAWKSDLAEAKQAARANNGIPVIPYMRQNALDGMCTRESGIGFGVEIEYDFPPDMSWEDRNRANIAIGRELYTAGITSTDYQLDAHASQEEGYDDSPRNGTWSWEEDGSVSGEIVTSIMYDEPETWNKLEQAFLILSRHGAVPNTTAGAHVHVSTGQFNGEGKPYTELLRLVNQHEDSFYRLSSNPFRGTHRNNGYASPLPRVPRTGFTDVQEVFSWQNNNIGRYTAVNLESCTGSGSDHTEIRAFDASLDAGTTQAQIKLAVGLVYAAKRLTDAGITTEREKEPLGSHLKRAEATIGEDNTAPQRNYKNDGVQDSDTTRSLLDTLFRRREDKKQFAAIFASTKWSTQPRNRY